MLIDEVLPQFDAHEVHSLPCPAPPGRAVAAALVTAVAGDGVASSAVIPRRWLAEIARRAA